MRRKENHILWLLIVMSAVLCTSCRSDKEIAEDYLKKAGKGTLQYFEELADEAADRGIVVHVFFNGDRACIYKAENGKIYGR